MTSPQPASSPQWTPGAGLARLQREMPHLIPAVITDEDRRKAEAIIAAGAGSGR